MIFLEKDLEVAALGVKGCLQQLQVAVESHWDSDTCNVCHRDFDILPGEMRFTCI